MSGSPIMVVFMILLFVVVTLFLMKNSLLQMFGNAKKIVNREGMQIEINGPTVRYREKGKKRTDEIQMRVPKFRIGSGLECELRFDLKSVEKVHAIIYRRIKGNEVYYELINYGKVNPVQYYNWKEKRYELLRYKERVILEDFRTGFYIGNIKIAVILSEVEEEPTPSDFVFLNNKKQNVKEEKKKEEQEKNVAPIDMEEEDEAIDYSEDGDRIVSNIIPTEKELEF